jgi:hypothetical protein
LIVVLNLCIPTEAELGLCAVVPVGNLLAPVPLKVPLPDTVKSPVTEFKLIAEFDAEVTNPFALTVTTDMFDEPPYVPAVTPVLGKEFAVSIPVVLAENKVVPVLERTIKVLSVSVVMLLTINVPAIILS